MQGQSFSVQVKDPYTGSILMHVGSSCKSHRSVQCTPPKNNQKLIDGSNKKKINNNKKQNNKNVRIITSGVREGNFIRVNIPSRTTEYLGEEPRTRLGLHHLDMQELLEPNDDENILETTGRFSPVQAPPTLNP